MQIIDILKITNLSSLIINDGLEPTIIPDYKNICIDNMNFKNIPYIPNTSFLGTLKHSLNTYKQCYMGKELSKIEASENELFGMVARYKNENAKIGRIKVLNLYTNPNNYSLEILQRTRLSYKTMSMQNNNAKMDAFVISAGHEFFTFLSFKKSGLDDYQIKQCLKYIDFMYDIVNEGLVQIGSQKSVGLGNIKIEKIKRIDIISEDFFRNKKVREILNGEINNNSNNDNYIEQELKTFYPIMFYRLSNKNILNNLEKLEKVKITV